MPLLFSNIHWIVFGLIIFICLILDLGVFHRFSHKIRLKEALFLSAFWITLSFAFNAWIFIDFGAEKGFTFLTAYLIEKSLSVDNIFVFMLIFSTFNVPQIYQHRVLFWGIIGAIVMRGILIYLGIQLVAQFEWVIFLFGVFLVFTGGKMFFWPGEKVSSNHNPALRFMRYFFPITSNYRHAHFFIREKGILKATPLFLALVTVEITDLIFAVDSIPAIFAITLDPFLVYTSNIFAILGLRALYFVLADLIERLVYLKAGISLLLCFVGVKMLLSHFYQIPIWFSLGFITLTLIVTTGASLLKTAPQRLSKKPSSPPLHRHPRT